MDSMHFEIDIEQFGENECGEGNAHDVMQLVFEQNQRKQHNGRSLKKGPHHPQ